MTPRRDYCELCGYTESHESTCPRERELGERELGEIVDAVNMLLDAEDMHLHNEAIFKGKWNKGSKAWSGKFIEKKVNEAMVRLRAILRPKV